MNRRFVRALSRTVDNAVLLALLVILFIATYALYDTTRVNEEADPAKYSTYKPTTEEGQKSFEELRAMNPDVMGWLTIYGTSIDYPIVKAQKDNFEYLSKDVEKNWTTCGALYVDVHNQWNFQDFNTIIHGHHMADHKMFGDLDLFTKADYFNEHQYANLYFDGANHGLEIFAILTIDAYDPIAATPNIQEKDTQQELLNSILSKRVQGRNVQVSTDDHIIIMTTCNLGETNGRYTLVAKLLDHEVANPFPEEEEETRTGTGRLDVFNVLNKFAEFTIWQWILFLILAIILIYLLYKLERRRLLKKKEKRLANEQTKQQPHKEDA